MADSRWPAARPRVLRDDVELMRIVAAFGIVWFHSTVAGYQVAYAGLVLFLMLSPFLVEQTQRNGPAIGQRFQRLIVPWAFWWLVYAAINLAQHHPVLPTPGNAVFAILASPSIHLWFLPFIFVSLVILDAVRSRTTATWRAGASGLAAGLLLATTPLWHPWSWQVGEPVIQYMQALPAVLLGIFFGNLRALPKAIWIPILAFATCAALTALHWPDVGLVYAIGIVAFTPLALGWFDRARIGWARPLAACTFGIYLIHPPILHRMRTLGLAHGVALPFLAFLAAWLAIALLRSAFPRWMARVA